MSRRKKRSANRDKDFLNQTEGREQINQLVSNAIVAAQNKAAVMKTLNIPVLEINMAASIEDNVAKVEKFIKTLMA